MPLSLSTDFLYEFEGTLTPNAFKSPCINEMLLNATIIPKQAVSKIVINKIKRHKLEILFCDFQNFSQFF
jgi:hypothetical protein